MLDLLINLMLTLLICTPMLQCFPLSLVHELLCGVTAPSLIIESTSS